MARRLDKGLADYLLIAISPALIMAMVGSLVFFLTEVLYQGRYEGRLLFVLGAFVMAAVLIGRVSIEFGAERAAMYAMPLALVTAMAIQKFIVEEGGTLGQFGLAVNLGMLGLIWWAAHQLVWDCTLIDETQDSSGQGLLQVAGLDRSAPAEEPPPAPLPAEPVPKTWRERLLDAPRRPHAPGVWIVYFALAALPIFGIGQAFIPAAQVEQRRYVFKLFLLYVSSGLGLLLSTSFLGLRRYLRQRKLQMPATMAGAWLTLGSVIIAAILGLALLLPRPSAEYTWGNPPPLPRTPEHEASRYAAGKEGTKDDRPDAAKVTQDDPAQPKTGEPKPSEQPKSPTAESEQGPKEAPPSDPQDVARKKPSSPDQNPQQNDRTKPPDEPRRGSPPGESPKPSPRAEEKPSEAKSPEEKSSERKPAEPPRPDEASSRSNTPETSLPRPNLLQVATQWAGVFFKWFAWICIGGVVLFWLWGHWRELVEEFLRIVAQLRDFWRRLFGGRTAPMEAIAETPAAVERRPGLASFADPFATGEAARQPVDAVIRYSFEALEAWGRERDCPRAADQTPHEFAEQAGEREPPLARHARILATLYCRAAYAPGTVPRADLAPLREFWRQLKA